MSDELDRIVDCLIADNEFTELRELGRALLSDADGVVTVDVDGARYRVTAPGAGDGTFTRSERSDAIRHIEHEMTCDQDADFMDLTDRGFKIERVQRGR